LFRGGVRANHDGQASRGDWAGPVTLQARNRAELVACLIGLGEARTVKVEAAARELLRPHEVSTVKDVLNLPAWPYGRLRIVIEQRLWRPLSEVTIEGV
jgi:hypothetical protein